MGVTSIDRIRNEYLRGTAGVERIELTEVIIQGEQNGLGGFDISQQSQALIECFEGLLGVS